MTHRQEVYYIDVVQLMSHLLVRNMDASTSHIPYYVLCMRLLGDVTRHNQDITDGEWEINRQVHRFGMSLVNVTIP
jgi:hypothetical protein